MTDAEVSFCKTGMMSVCTAETDAKQESCRFYKISLHTNKCMYFTFDEYCDCLKAQKAAV